MGHLHVIGEGRSTCGEACESPVWVKRGYLQPWHSPDVIVVPEDSTEYDELTASMKQGENNHKGRIRAMASRVLGAFRQT